ncbi:hypothetical protein [Streptomyces sp. NPDC001275]
MLRGSRAVVLGAALAAAATTALAHGVGTRADRPPDAKGSAPEATAAASGYGAAELRTDRGVPAVYRRLIVDSARGCARPDVTPALIAAMLKAESDFDPGLSDPAEDEYGIARWTPEVLRWWIRSDGQPTPSVPRPPFSPTVSVPAMGRYLCYIEPRLEAGLPGDRRVLIADAAAPSSARWSRPPHGVAGPRRGPRLRQERGNVLQPSWFVCKFDGGQNHGGPHPTRWVYTQADNGVWGWMSDNDIASETNPLPSC